MADEKTLKIKIVGDATSAIKAIEEVIKALEKLKDKTITVTVKVKQDDIKKVGDLGDATRGASRAAGEHARASSRAASGAREHGRAASEAAKGAREHARETEKANKQAKDLADNTRAMRSLESGGSGASSMRALGAGTSSANREMRALGEGARSLNAHMESIGHSAFRANRALEMRQSAVGVGRVSNGMRELSAGTSDARDEIGRLGRSAPRELRQGSDGVYRASSGMRELTEGASDARSEIQKLGRDTDRGSHRTFDLGTPGRVGGGGGGGGGRRGPLAIGPGEGDGILDDGRRLNAFGDAADKASSASMGLGRSMMVARAAGLGALGGLIVGGVAELGAMALGAGAAATSIGTSNRMMGETRSVAHSFTAGIKESAAAAAESQPMFKELRGAAGGLGREWGQLGAKTLPTMLSGTTSLARNATTQLDKLEDPINRATQSGFNLANSLTTALGNSGPALDQMSSALDRNASKLGNVVSGVVSFGSGLVSAGADVAGFISDTSDVDKSQAIGTSKFVGGLLAKGPGFIGRYGQGILDNARQDEAALAAGGSGGVSPGAVFGYVPPNQPLPHEAYNPAYNYGPGGQTAPKPGQATFEPMLDSRGNPIQPTATPSGGQTPGSNLVPPVAPRGLPQVGAAPRLGPIGPGQGVGNAGQLQALASSFDTASASAQQYGAATQGAMQQAQSGVAGVAPAMAGQMQGAQQAVQQAGSAIPPVAQSAFAAIMPAVAAITPAAAIAPPVAAAVATVSSAEPAMQSAGADLGSSMTSGTASGITKTETITVTTVRKYTENVVEEGKKGLDAHSPSRKFHQLGIWAGQGMAGGMGATERTVVSAADKMTGAGVNAAKGGDYVKSDGSGGKSQPGEGDKPRPSGNPGWSPATQERVTERKSNIAQYWAGKQEQHREAQDAALYRVTAPQGAAMPGDLKSQAEAWRAKGKPTPPVGGGGGGAGGGGGGAGGGDGGFWSPLRENVKESLGPTDEGELLKRALGIGRNTAEGLGQGMANGQGDVKSASKSSALAMIETLKRSLGIASPSKVTAGIGEYSAQGIGVGLQAGQSGVNSIASNAGLVAGYVYGTRFNDGVGSSLSVLKKSDLTAVTPPQIGSDQAKRWLQLNGLWSAAGSGAQRLKALTSTTLGGSSASAPGALYNTTVVQVGETVLAKVIDDRIALDWDRASTEYSAAGG